LGESNGATDDFIVNNHLEEYANDVLPYSTELCIAPILDAFYELGWSIRMRRPAKKSIAFRTSLDISNS
jgi:hypothetical protein